MLHVRGSLTPACLVNASSYINMRQKKASRPAELVYMF